MRRPHLRLLAPVVLAALAAAPARAQLTDITQTPNAANAGIQKSYLEEVGAGRGDLLLPDSSTFIIARDPFRAIVRGRQLFQRKFTRAQGHGPRASDGQGNISIEGRLGAGLADSCAACHGRPFGSAGVGGSVFTRPEGRDAPHLFGLGLKEMLADEITAELRATRAEALARAGALNAPVTLPLASKGIGFGAITAHPGGTLDTSAVEGVNPDLRVRPFFAEGSTVSIREFVVGAFKAEMGLEAFDPDLARAVRGEDVTTPSGMLLSGSQDVFEAPPVTSLGADGDLDGVSDEVPASAIDHLEFYLLNYFKPATGRQTAATAAGRATFDAIGCAACHVPALTIQRDRRVADVETAYDPNQANGVYSQLFATAVPRFVSAPDGTPHPALKLPRGAPFVVRGIYTDFKRHDLGLAFHERNFDGTMRVEMLTTPLWGVGSTAPYGHDGRSATLEDVILRHGGEAQLARDAFLQLAEPARAEVLAFLSSLVLFSPPDTPSNLDPADPSHPIFPILGHGSIDLSALFNDPLDKE